MSYTPTILAQVLNFANRLQFHKDESIFFENPNNRKQNLKIKSFFGRNRIEMQLWTAMIVYLLIWMIHEQFKYKGTKTELMRLTIRKLTVNIRLEDLLRPPNLQTRR